ncbi:hypothetical protein BTURTLESOX_1644 [bacterium endosymbiont of Bathymodiolus sp. 5 South]|nr:hypothetical protein BTURTLESOX_1644 [bacterium endosymbiont of Bathymodiolus sp. 5 South]
MIVIITAVFKVGGFKGKCSATQSEFILICVVDNRKTYPLSFVGLKRNHLFCFFRHRNIGRGNHKRDYFFCIYNFDSKVFISTLIDMITSSNGEVYITNSSNVPLGFEFITVDDFKISAVGGKSKGISSSISIWIGSTESTNHKSDTLVIVKSNKTIDIGGGIVDLDIGRSFIV